MSETPRCEPADPTADGLHILDGGERDGLLYAEWTAETQRWRFIEGDLPWRAEDIAEAGYLYASAVPTPAEIAALVDQASDALGELYLLGREHAGLVAALAAFPAKETTDE